MDQIDTLAIVASSGPRRRWPKAVTSLLVALLLTVLVFPEVVFLRGSLSSIGLYYPVIDRIDPPVVNVYPELEGRKPGVGQNDIAARIWQFEPATKFMNRVIYEGESPDWNPYAASGSLGPETLADMKLSPFVLLVALLGATSGAFSAVVLAFVVASLYCLQQFCIRTLNLSRTAAVAACVIFLLCGWAASTLTSQTSGPYLLFPVVLYALTEYQRVGGWPRMMAAVAAYAALLATTFLPGVILVLLLVHPVALLLDVSRRPNNERRGFLRQAGYLAGRQALIPVLGFMFTAYLWLPNLSALLHAGSEFDIYQVRALPTKPLLLYLSVLTPRHVFRWYQPDTIPAGVNPATAWTTYVGIASLIFVLAAFPRARGVVRRVLVLSTALMVFALLMHLGTPVIKLAGNLPGLRPIGWSYWGSLAGAAMVLAFACAVDTVARYGLSVRVAAGAAGVVAAGLGIALITTGTTSRAVAISLGFAGLVLVGVVLLSWLSVRRPNRRALVAVLSVGLVAVELFSYQNHQRLRRYDYEDHVPAYLSFVRDHVGDGRVYSAGQGALFGEWGSAFGIRMIETINLMQQPWYRTFFLTHVNSAIVQPLFLQDPIGDGPFTAESAALDLLSVRYLVVQKHLQRTEREIAQRYPLVFEDKEARVDVYENPHAFPRAFFSGALTTPNDSRLPSDAPWLVSTAFTEDAALLAQAAEQGIPQHADAIEGSAVIVEDHNTRVVVDVDAPSPGVLVLSDSYHPNWRATVNGEQEHLGRVDDIARGVVVPAGHSTVVFQYHSTARTIGAVISVLTIVGLMIAGATAAVRRRRPRTQRSFDAARLAATRSTRSARSAS